MGMYDYKNFGTADSKALFSDAMAITLYSYHNLDNGFATAYQHNGFGLGLPATLVTALLGGTDSQGVIPGIPWNPDSEKAALDAVQKAGWTSITASQLGYDGKVDARGTFFGEKAGYTTAQVEILGKYDTQGQLTEIGIAFRGTSGPRETLIGDSIGDVINDLLAAFGPKDYAKNYVGEAFGNGLDSLSGSAMVIADVYGVPVRSSSRAGSLPHGFCERRRSTVGAGLGRDERYAVFNLLPGESWPLPWN